VIKIRCRPSFRVEVKPSVHVGMLKIPAECDRDTASAKFKDISKLPASLLDISAATREH
jgi:hypothetical protein